MKVIRYLCWQSTSSPGSSPLIPCLQLQLSCSVFSFFPLLSSLFLLSVPFGPLLLFLSLPRPLPPPFLFLSLHLFESISVAATEEPAATVAWFPALWQKVTLSLAGKMGGGKKKRRRRRMNGVMEGDRGEQVSEEEEKQNKYTNRGCPQSLLCSWLNVPG